MTYREPRARVLDVQVSPSVSRITVELECDPWRPLAPASLCRDDDPAITLVQLHRLVALDGRRAVFETSPSGMPEIGIGSVVIFRSWWSADQVEVARAIHRPWQRTHFSPSDSARYSPDGSSETIPDGWDHEHCRLCWETFDEDTPYGYVEGADWLCGKCYDDFIASGLGAHLGDEV